MNKHIINNDHEKYYQLLEQIRKSGICNMWGATPYLVELADEEYGEYLPYEEAKEILCAWIDNYDELNKKFGWQ